MTYGPYATAMTLTRSAKAQDIIQHQQLELETTADNLRDNPQLFQLVETEAYELAALFDAAAHVFRRRRP